MKKYIMIFSVLAFAACNNAKPNEQMTIEAANEAANKEEMVKQRIVDSMTIVNLEEQKQQQPNVIVTSGNNNPESKNEEQATKKGMNNKTKGTLIGAGVGIVAGAATGAAVSKDKTKGAVVGGVIGGAVGSGVGYGVGSRKDKKEAAK